MTTTVPSNGMTESFEQGWVSVIVPTYNRADLLPQTLDSVARQTYRPIELVIVDDGSTDDTRAAVRAWSEHHAADDPLIVRYLNQPNRGVSAARNQGLRASRGEYIQFLDSDDRLRPDKLARHVDTLRADEQIDYVYAQTVQIGSDGTVRAVSGRPMDDAVPSRNIPLNLWHTSSPLYRRRICVQAGPWDEELCMSEDWEYAARIKAVSLKGRFVPDVLSEYIMHRRGQIVKHKNLQTIYSRNRAIHQVMDILVNKDVKESAAWDLCSRALVVNAIQAGMHGDRGLMRNTLLEAGRRGYTRTRGTALAMWPASFIVPPMVFKWLLNRIR